MPHNPEVPLTAEERTAWDCAVAGALTNGNEPERAATMADKVIVERRHRFGKTPETQPQIDPPVGHQDFARVARMIAASTFDDSRREILHSLNELIARVRQGQ